MYEVHSSITNSAIRKTRLAIAIHFLRELLELRLHLRLNCCACAQTPVTRFSDARPALKNNTKARDENLAFWQIVVTDPGFFGGGEPVYYLAKSLPKTAWKWNTLGWEGCGHPYSSPLDPPMDCESYLYYCILFFGYTLSVLFTKQRRIRDFPEEGNVNPIEREANLFFDKYFVKNERNWWEACILGFTLDPPLLSSPPFCSQDSRQSS